MTGLVDNALMVFEDSILISLQTMSAMWVAFWLLFHMALLKPQSVLEFSLFFKVNLQVIYCNIWFPKLPTKCTYLWCLWLIYSPLSFPISSPPKFSSCEEADPVKKKKKDVHLKLFWHAKLADRLVSPSTVWNTTCGWGRRIWEAAPPSHLSAALIM